MRCRAPRRSHGDPRCLVADDHPALLPRSPSYLSENGFEVVGPVTDGRRAVALAAETKPELALSTSACPGSSGTELVRQIKEASPETVVAVYTADADQAMARDVMEAGAVALVLKEAPLADLVRALEAALAGGSYLDPALQGDGAASGKLTAARAGRPAPARRGAPARGDRPSPRNQLRDRAHSSPQGLRPARRDDSHAGGRDRTPTRPHHVTTPFERQLEVASLSGEVEAVMAGIVTRLMEFDGADGASLSTIDDESRTSRCAKGADAELRGKTLPLDRDARRRVPQATGRHGAPRGDRGRRSRAALTPGAGAIVLAPIEYDDAIRGILGVRSADADAFGKTVRSRRFACSPAPRRSHCATPSSSNGSQRARSVCGRASNG